MSLVAAAVMSGSGPVGAASAAPANPAALRAMPGPANAMPPIPTNWRMLTMTVDGAVAAAAIIDRFRPQMQRDGWTLDFDTTVANVFVNGVLTAVTYISYKYARRPA